MIDQGNPDLGKTPEELALEREIAEHAAAGREPEREAAAWRLAEVRTEKKFGRRL